MMLKCEYNSDGELEGELEETNEIAMLSVLMRAGTKGNRRPDDSTVMVGLACGSLSGIASSTGCQEAGWDAPLPPISNQSVP
ncbi:hypothetical protein L6452_06252 [Arctium lappa]|uniref:Uncharacterized protein n=1 Tax=Arctium lappa TaxID=4217 RepID=A0ACB9EJQ2_ARCLA|nr:hypothetical protein L6452_06252 [Arctium lappa]